MQYFFILFNSPENKNAIIPVPIPNKIITSKVKKHCYFNRDIYGENLQIDS